VFYREDDNSLTECSRTTNPYYRYAAKELPTGNIRGFKTQDYSPFWDYGRAFEDSSNTQLPYFYKRSFQGPY